MYIGTLPTFNVDYDQYVFAVLNGEKSLSWQMLYAVLLNICFCFNIQLAKFQLTKTVPLAVILISAYTVSL